MKTILAGGQKLWTGDPLRFTRRLYALIYLSLSLLGIAYISIIGIHIAPDTATYSRWADMLIQCHFNYSSYLANFSSVIPYVLYVGWVTVVALFKLALLSHWHIGLIVLNVVLYAAIGTALVFIVVSLSHSKICALIAWLMYTACFDLLQWMSFVLSDVSGLALTFSPFLVYILYLNRRRQHLMWFLGLMAILTLAFFYCPSNIPLIATFTICALITVQTSVIEADQTRVSYSRFLFFFVTIGIIVAFILVSILAQNTNLWQYSPYYHNGTIIHDRPETFLKPPVTLIDYVTITLDRFICYFSPNAAGFSFLHNALSSLFYLPLYCLAGFSFLCLFSKNGYRDKKTWLVTQTASLFVLFYAAFHAVTLIDFDWRYRAPCIPVLILLAALGVDRILCIYSVRRFVDAIKEKMSVPVVIKRNIYLGVYIMKNSLLRKALAIIRTEGPCFLVKKMIAKIQFKFLLLPLAIINVKNTKLTNLRDLTQFCFDDVFGLIKPQQFQSEILGLITKVNGIKPQKVIEIGTSRGGTLFLLCRVAAEDATIISIDFPDRRFGGSYPLWKIPLYNAFKLPKQKLYLVRADSHEPETLTRVKKLLNGEKADFIFIDGDHSYEGVRQDFEMYSPLLGEKGLMAFHDIVVHPVEAGCGVSKVWDELKQYGYKYEEIVADVNQDWGGIGILYESRGNK